MQPCNHDALSRYLDGELAPTTRADLERHLLECSDCAAEIVTLRRLNALLIRWGTVRDSLPTQTEARIVDDVQRSRASSRVLTLSRMMPAAMGSTVAAILVLLSANIGLLYRTSPATPVVSASRGQALTVAQKIKQETAVLQRVRRTEAMLGSGRITVSRRAAPNHATSHLT